MNTKPATNAAKAIRESLLSARLMTDEDMEALIDAQFAPLVLALRAIAKDPYPPTKGGCCLECGAWTPRDNPERHDHKEGCKANQLYEKEPNPRVIAREALKFL